MQYKTPVLGSIAILNGGFPINFDRVDEASSPNDIQLTRALIFASVLQAARLMYKKRDVITPGFHKLDVTLQRFVAQEWIKCQPVGKFSKCLIDFLENINLATLD